MLYYNNKWTAKIDSNEWLAICWRSRFEKRPKLQIWWPLGTSTIPLSNTSKREKYVVVIVFFFRFQAHTSNRWRNQLILFYSTTFTACVRFKSKDFFSIAVVAKSSTRLESFKSQSNEFLRSPWEMITKHVFIFGECC